MEDICARRGMEWSGAQDEPVHARNWWCRRQTDTYRNEGQTHGFVQEWGLGQIGVAVVCQADRKLTVIRYLLRTE